MEKNVLGDIILLLEQIVQFGDNVKIDSGAYIFPNVTIYKNVNIGENVIIHSGTVIGSDGFGYANENNSWTKSRRSEV